MSQSIIQVENLSKLYRLDRQDSASSLRDEFEKVWKTFFGKKTQLKQYAFVHLSEAQRGPKPDTFWALKDISFSVKPGEVVGIIGKNGSGKSTLLKILSQVTQPTSGRAVIQGRVSSLLEIGTGFHPELSGRENVFLNGSILGMKKNEIEKKFDEIVSFSGIEDFIDSPVKHYSSGMYVRLAFSVAAHLDPDVLIVDEALSVGDLEFQRKSMDKIRQSAREGTTVLFVSHNMATVLGLAEHVLLLDQGRLVENNDSCTAVRRYENKRTAELPVSEAARPGIFNLQGAVRSGGDQEIKIEKLILRNASGEITNRFGFREPIALCIQFSSRLRSDLFEIGYTLYSQGGGPLFTSSSCFGGKFQRVEEGVFEIQTRLEPNHLKMGIYKIQLGTMCGVLRDLIPQAGEFQILDSPDLNDAPITTLLGHFCFDYKWQPIQPLAQLSEAK